MARAAFLGVAAIMCVSAIVPSANAADAQEAGQFAQAYRERLKAQRASATQDTGNSDAQALTLPGEQPANRWTVEAELRGGVATYKEEEEGIESEYITSYPEGAMEVRYRHRQRAIELALQTAIGQSASAEESWDVNGALFQTNDLDFLRLDSGIRIGKVIQAEMEHLEVVPFVGYGFRYVKFDRENFNILNLITIRQTVTESYDIHHVDAGLTFEYAADDRWRFSGLASIGHVLRNQADNSVLGTVKGRGGTLGTFRLDAGYAFGPSWQFMLGAFTELQSLQGGEKDNVVWPDNDLNLYGGTAKLRLLF